MQLLWNFPSLFEVLLLFHTVYLLCHEFVIIFSMRFCFVALNLSDRTSASAFDTKIKIQIQQGKFEDALELLTEWQMNEPDVREATE